MNGMMLNALSTSRSQLLTDMLNIGKDINYSCGYPTFITMANYKEMFDREGAAKRVVTILPEESWAVHPEVVENETGDDTEFEEAWKTLQEEKRIYHYLKRADILSGIGRYGILLLGISDGDALENPVAGINEVTGEKQGEFKWDLLYLRPFDESVVKIQKVETDSTSPRFGFPTKYSIQFEDSSQLSASISGTVEVHWTRVLHLADNREVSEVFGTPRMKPVYNRLLDIRKVLSGSGEMFWKGAFPGYSFEINNDIKNATLDSESLRKEFQNYSAGLQRYLAIDGVSAKSLAPQVSSPIDHIKAQIENIALTLGIPLRILIGSEQAKLASTQDKSTWNDRMSSRQNHYVSPMIISPLIDRLITFGILPEPKKYNVFWSDLNMPSDRDKAEVGRVRTEAISKYVVSGSAELVPPKEFLTIVLGMTEEEVTVIESAADKWSAPDEPEPDPLEDSDDE